MLKYALEYASLGYKVFPVFGVMAGRCRCGKNCTSPGKHPMLDGGHNNATDNTDQITKWWSSFPDANIGIRTGHESGLIVIDIDGQDIQLPGSLPATAIARTGSGGKHILFKHPGQHVKNCTGVFPSVDSRADGGYIVAPPSMHISGNQYQWIISPTDQLPGPAPSWWIDAVNQGTHRPNIAKSQISDGQKIPSGSRNATLTSYAGTLRRNGADYDELLSALIMRNKKCDPPLPPEEVETIARSISGYQVQTQEDIENYEHGHAMVESLMASEQLERTESLASNHQPKKNQAPDLIPKHGLIKDIANYILQTSIRPQPLLAVAAATAFVGMLGGRKYRTETNLRSNLYIVGLAESGAGKDHARKIIDEIAMECDLGANMGSSRIASGQGLYSALVENPVKLYQLDEFGLMLQSLTGNKAASHQREIVNLLLQAYSSASSILRGVDYADRRLKPQEPVIQPHCCLYATSTHDTFYQALSSGEAVNGTVSRMIVVNVASDKRPKRSEGRHKDIPPMIIEKIKSLKEYQPPETAIAGQQSNLLTCKPYTVPYSDGIEQALYDLDDSLDDLMTTPHARSIYSRVAESTAKLAMTHAIAQDCINPVITMESFIWAREFALWSANTLMEHISIYLSDNETESKSKRLERVIKDAGFPGLSKTELWQRTRWLSDQERTEMLQTMFDAGVIERDEIKPVGPGRPRIIIRHN